MRLNGISTVLVERGSKGNEMHSNLGCSVADPDPASHFDADADPDPTFTILPFNLIRIPVLPLNFPQIWTLQCSKNNPLRLPPFHFDADPDPASQNDAEPC
jgi:hypothetical protein